MTFQEWYDLKAEQYGYTYVTGLFGDGERGMQNAYNHYRLEKEMEEYEWM